MLLRLLPLLLCITGELLLITLFRNRFGALVSPVIHTVFSLGTGIYLIWLSRRYNRDIFSSGRLLPLAGWHTRPVWLLLLIPFVIAFTWILNDWFRQEVIDMHDASKSDIIPSLMFYAKRTLNGEFPYTPMRGDHWLHTVKPNYFPMQWLPYVLAEYFHFDYRWIPNITLLAVLAFYYIKLFRIMDNRKPVFWLLFVLPVVITGTYLYTYAAVITITVEGLIIGYYAFTGFALLQKRLFWLAIAVILCLLSRYSLVIWIPLLLLILLHQYGFKKAFFFALALVAGFLLIYGPFWMQQPAIFSKGFTYYMTSARNLWALQPWQEPGETIPYHLQQGYGLSILVFKYVGGSFTEKYELYSKLHIYACLFTLSLLMAGYWIKRKSMHPGLFALAGLKILLVVFYAFIPAPFNYLYTVPLFLNLPIVIGAVMALSSGITGQKSPKEA